MESTTTARQRIIGPAFAVLVLMAATLTQSPAFAAPNDPPTIMATTFHAWDVDFVGTNDVDGQPVASAERNARTVSGTSLGTTGDLITVYCVTRNPAQFATLKDNVAVQADGSWSAATSSSAIYMNVTSHGYVSCKLAAVWKGQPIPTFAAATGLEIHGLQETTTYRNSVTEDVWINYIGTDGTSNFGTNPNCSLCDMSSVNPETGAIGIRNTQLFWWAAGLWGSLSDKSLLTVDGKEVWGGYQVNAFSPLSDLALRKPDLSLELNPNTGLLTLTESVNLSYCPASSSLTIPSEPACFGALDAKMISAGVRHTRVTVLLPDGQSYFVDDTFESTDGNSHVIDARYVEGGISDRTVIADWKLPAGVTGVAGGTWIDGATITRTFEASGFSAGITRLDLTSDFNSPNSYQNAVGAVIYGQAPDKVTGLGRALIATEFLGRTVDPMHPLMLGANYVQASSAALLESRVTAATADARAYLPQAVVSWSPNLVVRQSAKSLSALATTTRGTIAYSVKDAGTTGCTINASTGAVSFAGAGTCVLQASVSATNSIRPGSAEIALTVIGRCSLGNFGTVNFTSDTAGLSTRAKTQLKNLASIVATDGCSKLSVVGYGPMLKKVKGSFGARKAAAMKRATAVKTYLAGLLKKSKVTISVSASVRPDSGAKDKNAAAAKAQTKANVSAKP